MFFIYEYILASKYFTLFKSHLELNLNFLFHPQLYNKSLNVEFMTLLIKQCALLNLHGIFKDCVNLSNYGLSPNFK